MVEHIHQIQREFKGNKSDFRKAKGASEVIVWESSGLLT